MRVTNRAPDRNLPGTYLAPVRWTSRTPREALLHLGQETETDMVME